MQSGIRLALFAVSAAVLLAACSASPKPIPATRPTAASAVAHATSAAPATSAAKSSAASAATLSGTWSGHYTGSYQGSFTLTWTQSGGKLTGTIKISTPASTMGINGAVQGDSISFGTVGSYGITYSGKVSGDSMAGSYQVEDGHGSGGPWNAAKTG